MTTASLLVSFAAVAVCAECTSRGVSAIALKPSQEKLNQHKVFDATFPAGDDHNAVMQQAAANLLGRVSTLGAGSTKFVYLLDRDVQRYVQRNCYAKLNERRGITWSGKNKQEKRQDARLFSTKFDENTDKATQNAANNLLREKLQQKSRNYVQRAAKETAKGLGNFLGVSVTTGLSAIPILNHGLAAAAAPSLMELEFCKEHRRDITNSVENLQNLNGWTTGALDAQAVA